MICQQAIFASVAINLFIVFLYRREIDRFSILMRALIAVLFFACVIFDALVLDAIMRNIAEILTSD